MITLRAPFCILVPMALFPSPSTALSQEAQAEPEGNPPPTAEGGEVMVVTATRQYTPVFDSSYSVTVITAEELARLQLQTTPDLFQGVNAVYIQKTNTGGGSPFLRGMTGKQVLILVDGIRLNNSFYRFGPHQYLNTLDPNLIERIEVVRGPASVLYGSDALGGVINIITRRREDYSQPSDVTALTRLHGGLADEHAGARVQVEGNKGSLGYLGGVSATHFGDLRGGGDIGVQIPTSYDEVDGDLKLHYHLGIHHMLTLSEQITRQYDVPKTSEVTLGDKLQFNYEPQLRSLSYLEYEGKDVVDRWLTSLKITLSLNHQSEGEAIIKESTPDIETRDITTVDTLGLGLQAATLPLPWMNLVYGAEWYQDNYSTEKVSETLSTGEITPATPLIPDGASYLGVGAYLQDSITIANVGELVVGSRFSHFEAYAQIPSPDGEAQAINLNTSALTSSARALVRLSNTLHLVGGISQGFRAPNMEDFIGKVDFYGEVPNPDLQPEESLNREVGVKVKAGTTSADVGFYRANYEGLITRVTIGEQEDGTPIQQRQNLGKAQIQGVEAALAHTTGPWTLSGNATYTEGIDLETQAYLRRIPPLNGGAKLRYEPGERLWTELSCLWAFKQDDLAQGDIDDPRIGPDGTPGYGVVNVTAGYHPSYRHTFILSGENLTDVTYKTHGSGVYGPGRNLQLSWRAIWG